MTNKLDSLKRKEVDERSRIRYQNKIKHTQIVHLKAGDRTLCAKLILWNTNLTEGTEDPTCGVCLNTLRRADR